MKALLARQPVRFLLAGCVNTALDFLILNALTLLLGLPVVVANTISVCICISVSYVLNHKFVFRHPEPLSWRKFLPFFGLTGISSLVIQNLIIFGFESFFNTTFGHSLLIMPTSAGRAFVAINVAKAVAVLVGLVWNFFFYKFVVFRRPAAKEQVEIFGAEEVAGA